MKYFLMVMLCVVMFVIGFFSSPTKSSGSVNKIIYSIDSVIVDRQHFIMDTIKVKEKTIDEKHDTTIKYVDDVFKTKDDTAKVSLFNSYYPRIDTTYLMRITDGQAHSAITEKINHSKDSSLMVLYKKSSDDCDNRLSIIKTKVDTVKEVYKQNVDSVAKSSLIKGSIFGASAIVIPALAYILLCGGK